MRSAICTRALATAVVASGLTVGTGLAGPNQPTNVHTEESAKVPETETDADKGLGEPAPSAAQGNGDTASTDAAGDAGITSAIKARLSSNIDVDTKNGTVTLSGVVSSMHAKMEAQAEAQKVSGVKKVVNAIQVAPSK